ncbi:MAG TPA: hypothetical protein DCF62_09690, partial [Porticoccaceae bacterium]|nr:hypothetical protein [Porticoccaceae bacterium]
MKVLVTGVAGFIGSHVALRLLARGDEVVGLDNLNDYYEVSLKEARLARVEAAARSEGSGSFNFVRLDVADRVGVERLFTAEKFDRVVHLAAQAGVRYSIENPHAYIDSNIVGFTNILEGCRHNQVEHLVYASSSSVYGANENLPFSVHDNVDHPLSLYAASKKANELMAHTYSHLYQLPTTGLRFFTVYGPWGRPDMAHFLFTDAILRGRPIKVFNEGEMSRDFTYVDDLVDGIVGLMAALPGDTPVSARDSLSPVAPFRVVNIGGSRPTRLMDFIAAIEEACGREAEKRMMPMQPGDV